MLLFGDNLNTYSQIYLIFTCIYNKYLKFVDTNIFDRQNKIYAENNMKLIPIFY